MQQNTSALQASTTKPDPQQLAQLVTQVIVSAQESGFEAYQVTATLRRTNDGFSLSPLVVQKGVTKRNPKFGLPNVFAPILVDTQKAKDNGTIFHAISDSYICINDKFPVAATHVLIIPRKEVITLPELSESARGELFAYGITTALDTLHLSTAILSINVYPPLQEVPHIHLHITSEEKIS